MPHDLMIMRVRCVPFCDPGVMKLGVRQRGDRHLDIEDKLQLIILLGKY